METTETTKQAGKRKSKKTAKKLTLIDAIETVIEISENSQLKSAALKGANREIKFLADSYGISETQAVLFCIAMAKGPHRIDLDDLARYLNINSIRMLQYGDDINALMRRRLIRYRDAKDEDQFDIYPPVIKALKHNSVYSLAPRTGLTCEELLEQLNSLFTDLYEDAITGDEAIEESAKLLDDNIQVGFSKEIHTLKLPKREQGILTYFCHRLINEQDDDIRITQLDDLICNKSEFQKIKRGFRTGGHVLFAMGLLEHGCVDGIADNSRYKLTNNAKRTLLAELDVCTPTRASLTCCSLNSSQQKRCSTPPPSATRLTSSPSSSLRSITYRYVREWPSAGSAAALPASSTAAPERERPKPFISLRAAQDAR